MVKLELNNFLLDLEKIVNISSWSKDPEGVSKVAFALKELFEKSKMNVKVKDFGTEIGKCLEVSNCSSEEFDFLLIGHIDTVFPKEATENRFFEIKGNRALGPGVADMKSGIILGYHVLKTINNLNLNENEKPKICMAINSDEEIGSRISRHWLEELAKKSKYVLVLEPGESDGSILKGRKGIAAYEVDFQGIPSHAGIEPEKGRSAIAELGHWIVKLHGLTNLDIGTSLNVGVVSGGTVSNVIAPWAKARVDLRIIDPLEKDRIEGIMSSMCENPEIEGVKVKFTCTGSRPPMNPNEKTFKLCEKIEEIGRKNEIPIKWTINGGGSDANFISELNIPVLDGLGPVGGGCHGENEYIEIESINTRFKLLMELLLQKSKSK